MSPFSGGLNRLTQHFLSSSPALTKADIASDQAMGRALAILVAQKKLKSISI